jgi:putative CocE/NonD family hydrolase
MVGARDPRIGYNDYYYGGVFRQEHQQSQGRLFGGGAQQLVLDNPTYNATWAFVEQQNQYLDSVQVPLCVFTGWFDHDPGHIIDLFAQLQAETPAAVRQQHKLIVGPWLHSSIDLVQQGLLSYPNADGIMRQAAADFFGHYLLGQTTGWPSQPTIRYYHMGQNVWQSTDSWASLGRRSDTLWFAPAGGLLSEAVNTTGTDTLVVDPRNPAPSIGGNRFNPFAVPPIPIGPQPLDPILTRSDVRVYQTPVLADTLELNGGLRTVVWLSSDQLDTDVMVRLADVQPNGQALILVDGIHRARYRNSLSSPSLLTPGVPVAVEVKLDPLVHSFLPGHRLMLVVGGNSSPEFALNLQNGGTQNVAGDTLTATNIIRWGGTTQASHFIFETTRATPVLTNRLAADANTNPNGELRLYPNPATESCLLNVTGGHGVGTLRISNALGQELLRQEVTLPLAHPLALDLGAWPAGVYVVRLSTPTQADGWTQRLWIRK